MVTARHLGPESLVANRGVFLPFVLQARSACVSDCTLQVQSGAGQLLHYNFSSLANLTGFRSAPRFTSRGLRYFQHFHLGLCGKEVGIHMNYYP